MLPHTQAVRRCTDRRMESTYEHTALPETCERPGGVRGPQAPVRFVVDVKALTQAPPVAIPVLTEGPVNVALTLTPTPARPHLGQAAVENAASRSRGNSAGMSKGSVSRREK